MSSHSSSFILLKSDGSIVTEQNKNIDLGLKGDTFAFSNGQTDYAVGFSYNKDNGKINEGTEVSVIKL